MHFVENIFPVTCLFLPTSSLNTSPTSLRGHDRTLPFAYKLPTQYETKLVTIIITVNMYLYGSTVLYCRYHMCILTQWEGTVDILTFDGSSQIEY